MLLPVLRDAEANVATPYFQRRAPDNARRDRVITGMLFWIALGFTTAAALIWELPSAARYAREFLGG